MCVSFENSLVCGSLWVSIGPCSDLDQNSFWLKNYFLKLCFKWLPPHTLVTCCPKAAQYNYYLLGAWFCTSISVSLDYMSYVSSLLTLTELAVSEFFLYKMIEAHLRGMEVAGSDSERFSSASEHPWKEEGRTFRFFLITPLVHPRSMITTTIAVKPYRMHTPCGRNVLHSCISSPAILKEEGGQMKCFERGPHCILCVKLTYKLRVFYSIHSKVWGHYDLWESCRESASMSESRPELN